MLASFTPLNDEELEALEKPLEPGNATFEVVSCEQKYTSNNNMMFVLQLNVKDVNGTIKPVKDYIVAAGLGMRKLKHFCETIGFMNEYKQGLINILYLPKKRGHCVIGIREGENKQGNPIKFTEIIDYITSPQPVENNAEQSPEVFDDEIPF